MRQYLVAIHHPDDYDASLEDEAMHRDIDALNDEMKAAVSGSSLAAAARQAARGHCGCSPMIRCSSPTGRTWKLRSTSAVFGCSKPLTWTRRWHGDARPLLPVGRRPRCARLADGESIEILLTAPAAGERKPVLKETA